VKFLSFFCGAFLQSFNQSFLVRFDCQLIILIRLLILAYLNVNLSFNSPLRSVVHFLAVFQFTSTTIYVLLIAPHSNLHRVHRSAVFRCPSLVIQFLFNNQNNQHSLHTCRCSRVLVTLWVPVGVVIGNVGWGCLSSSPVKLRPYAHQLRFLA
jgi:hypothetical protein